MKNKKKAAAVISGLVGNLLDRSAFLEDLLFIRKDISPDTRAVLLHAAQESSQFASDLELLLVKWGEIQKSRPPPQDMDKPNWNFSGFEATEVLELVRSRDLDLITAYEKSIQSEQWPNYMKTVLSNHYHALRSSDAILQRLKTGKLSGDAG